MKWLLAVAAVVCLPAAETPAEFFETKVRPVLAKNCFSCHTQSRLGGLAMLSREDLLKGGKSGPAFVAGEPEKSLLVQAVAQTHATLKMPPSGKLDDASIGAIRTWVKDGAVWPEGPKGKPYSVSAEQKQWSNNRKHPFEFSVGGSRRIRTLTKLRHSVGTGSGTTVPINR